MALVVNELSNLRMDCLDHGWAKAIYDAEFLEFENFPPEYESAIESLDVQATFKKIIKSVSRWLSAVTEPGEEKSWATLSHQIQHQKVLAILAYYIDNGCKNILTKECRNNALLASRVYYKLLSIPGYKAYHIYHSQLFAHSLACLNFPKMMCEEDNFFNSKELTREVNLVINELRHFVIDLRAIIENLQLNPSDMNFEDILSNLVEVTGGAIVKKSHVDKVELAKITMLIYEIINILLCDAAGEPDPIAIKLLFKCLLPKLVASSMDHRSANTVQASYVTYTGLVLSKYGKAAVSGFTVLLEHLTHTQDGLERAEVRTARVNLVVGLMSLLPHKFYRKMVKWLLQLSTTSKMSHRQIAMEMLASLLSNDPDEHAQNNETANTNNDPTAGENNKQTTGSQPDTSPAEDNQTTETQNEVPQKYTMVTDDESSQDSQIQVPAEVDPDQELTEEEVANLLRQRPHTVPHAEILRAVYERVHDVSSTLRARAIAILADCVDSSRVPMINAVKELNGDGSVSRLLAVSVRSVCDERAAVRRAGATLAHRLLAQRAAPPPTPTDVAILVNLCRDASILVRSSAITALGDLMTLRPSELWIDAFLTGPMLQLADPENKVQEQVVSLIQQVLIDRLSKFVAPGCDDPLPWMFLGGISRQNMRRHLQKACAMLVKSASCINHRIVDILSTHLGMLNDERDLQCLILLTSVARHVDYSNIGFVLDYYYKLADNEENRDVRLMSLTLELICSWSRFAQAHERSALRDHLVRRLAAARDDGCRIQCATLASELDPENLTWATELMQLSERRAVQSGEVEEAIRAADLSLVAPTPPSAALLTLFLNALNEPPPEWGAERVGASVAGLGRLCVRARVAAAAAAPPLAALLTRAAAPLVARINALLALTDICIRYTCIVEPLLDTVCGCLSLESPAALRRAAASALTKLLLGGYLRLRTPLYYRYCALLADDDLEVRGPAEYYVTCSLTTDAIYHHFVDCVLYYNNVDTENIKFDARQLIYDVMLQRMSLVQKLNIQCRLAREVFENAADFTDESDEELPPAMNAALLDTITLLCGPRMKLPKKPQNTGDNDIDDLQERITTNIVSHKMKRTVAEVLVPAVLRLYTRLKPRGGQIATYLVGIATDLLNDYQQEIEELIENDEELVERVQQFQETIGSERTFGNVRNLVTTTAPPEPDTPRAPRRRRRSAGAPPPRKRALRI